TNDNIFIVFEFYIAKNPAEFSWAIGQLDDYEGMSVEPDEVQFYRREITEVHINGQLTHAWIYWYNGDVSGRPLIASGDMIQYLQEKK
ncbi:MAG: gamma-glutamylcyclotransferase family protein, partial [Bacteroidota bacterium]